jgi:hypothetical protein
MGRAMSEIASEKANGQSECPMEAALEVRMRSAKCFGGRCRTTGNRASIVLPSGGGTVSAELVPRGLLAPQDSQTATTGAAHWPQNFIRVGFSAWHRRHTHVGTLPGRKGSDA